MLRDLLGNRVKNNNHKRQQRLMERYYIFNNKVYQIIRAGISYKLDGGMYYSFTVQDINTKKVFFKEYIWEKDFVDMTFYKKRYQAISKLDGFKKFKYNHAYFLNDNIELVEKLYNLGYENFSEQTSISYHQYPYTVIKKGRLMTYSNTDFEIEGKKYRQIELVDNEIVVKNNKDI